MTLWTLVSLRAIREVWAADMAGRRPPAGMGPHAAKRALTTTTTTTTGAMPNAAEETGTGRVAIGSATATSIHAKAPPSRTVTLTRSATMTSLSLLKRIL